MSGEQEAEGGEQGKEEEKEASEEDGEQVAIAAATAAAFEVTFGCASSAQYTGGWCHALSADREISRSACVA